MGIHMSKKVLRLALIFTMVASMMIPMTAFADDLKIPGGVSTEFGGIYAGDQTIAHYVQNGEDTYVVNVGKDKATLTSQNEVSKTGKAWKIAPSAANWGIWAENSASDAGNWVSLGGGLSSYMDLSDYSFNNLAFGFWMRADQATWNSNWSIAFRFKSIYQGTTQILYWNKWADELGLKNGEWAYVTLNFKDAEDESNWTKWNTKPDNFDLAHVQQFSMTASGGVYADAVYLDDMNFVDISKTPAANDITGLSKVVLPTGENVRTNAIFNCDNAGEMEGFTVNTENKTEGNGSLSYTFKGGELKSIVLDPALTELAQLKNADAAYLVFDLYVENAGDLVRDMQVQTFYNVIAGANDDNNMTWWIKHLHNGWNRLVLPFSSTAGSTKLGYADAVLNGAGALYLKDDMMFSAANSLRLIVNPTKDTTVLLDNISIVSVGADDIVEFQPTLTGVTFDITEVKTEYAIGEKLDLSKLIATAEYDDGTTADVTKEVSVNDAAFDATKEGTYEIELSYGDGAFTKSFEVIVSAKSSDDGGKTDNDSNGNASSVGNESNTDTGVTGTAGALMLFGLSACGITGVFMRKRFVK